MEYLLLTVIAVITIVVGLRLFNKNNIRKKLEKLKKQWGKPKSESYHFDWIRAYANAINSSSFHQLTEQTIEDIDFYNLFAFIDRTTSKVGQQFLFKRVTEPTNSLKNELEDFTKKFADNPEMREEVQLELIKLNHSDAYYIPSLLRGKLLKRPKWLNLLYLNLMVIFLLLILSFTYSVCIIILLAPLTVNIFLHYWNKNNAFQFVKSFPQLNQLINTSQALLKKDQLFFDSSTQRAIEILKPFQQKWRLIGLTGLSGGIESELSLIGTYFFELLKAFFLIEVLTLFWVAKELESKQASIIKLFEFIGRLDTSISIASLRAGSLKTCQPNIGLSVKETSMKNLYHPLIENCIKNDLTISDKSVMITGSNMSGKSTFLRTLAINSILAQTIFTCFADEFNSPILKQFSSIRIDDSLLHGKSYYLQEVDVMGSLIVESESADQNLFVLDEVFKGTNTVERIAIAKAVLTYLNKGNNIVIIATHDVELSEMLSAEYDLYHFSETIEDNQLYFDHKIKVGQLRTRNAIKILELANYPAEIIVEAKSISEKLS